MDTRQEFEEWYEAESMPAESDWFLMDDGEYEHEHTHGAWMAWHRQQRRHHEHAAMIKSLREVVFEYAGRLSGVLYDLSEIPYGPNETFTERETRKEEIKARLGKINFVLDNAPAQSLTAHDNAVRVEAHMAGQADAGVDPSWANAQEYVRKYEGEG